MLDPDTILVAAKEQTSTQLDGEAVVVNLADGYYYQLNSVGSAIWECLQKPTSIREIHRAVLEQYEVDDERSLQDLQELIHDLLEAHLIEIRT